MVPRFARAVLRSGSPGSDLTYFHRTTNVVGKSWPVVRLDFPTTFVVRWKNAFPQRESEGNDSRNLLVFWGGGVFRLLRKAHVAPEERESREGRERGGGGRIGGKRDVSVYGGFFAVSPSGRSESP